MTLSIDGIVQALREEKSRIENAIAALEGITPGLKNGRRRRQAGQLAKSRPGKSGRRRLSAAARKKISQAAKARWAAAKKAGKNAL